eukprot:GILJ01043430.1.p1 GENE.GILJ01043430.1~~GILJ01043430.1.p1  ORF type:complete len:110 (+),score=16.32 GILJ01043430.1:288-617(+)
MMTRLVVMSERTLPNLVGSSCLFSAACFCKLQNKQMVHLIESIHTALLASFCCVRNLVSCCSAVVWEQYLYSFTIRINLMSRTNRTIRPALLPVLLALLTLDELPVTPV